ncbi:aspartate carbamoyltransferase [Kibdelosporangium persicum]|uniref:Aspartate carbamoyltransferase n=1 Tax=Kibdelosporangium persicum TaxID=2698649 RepID=A0ABX2EVV3_9PSEU|nr:aspartate carbamoyltransferase [Kibdelosporangium persicum]NRN63078.1 Aspartate carbamoyltransferase [Kibdelosporangium persicum]
MKVPEVVPVLLLVAALGTACSEPTRQAEVAERGKTVMPFDLEKTTHRFTPRDNGLVQEVVADQPGDTGQITLIRQHLVDESERFRRGDFADPSKIHGETMPGLKELSAGAQRITIEYRERVDGAELSFRTGEAALVKALHSWGEAQVSDHGSHAEHGTK